MFSLLLVLVGIGIALVVTFLSRKGPEGFKIIIRRSKTDQEGHGETIAIVPGGVCCPVEAVKTWLQAGNISDGPLFRPVRRQGRPARCSAAH